MRWPEAGFPLVKAASWMSHLEVDPVSPAMGIG